MTTAKKKVGNTEESKGTWFAWSNKKPSQKKCIKNSRKHDKQKTKTPERKKKRKKESLV